VLKFYNEPDTVGLKLGKETLIIRAPTKPVKITGGSLFAIGERDEKYGKGGLVRSAQSGSSPLSHRKKDEI